jgi:DMSO/TMAO reductase YedYZ molybdopterin-dependent catalytic subunit
MKTVSGMVAVCLLLCALAASGCTGTTAQDDPAWNLTLVGDGEKVLSMKDIRALPAWEGHGYAVSTTGIKYGPYTVKGVPLTDLADQVGGFPAGGQAWISAPDGYLWVFDDEQVDGEGFITLNEDLKEIPSPDLTVVLAYEFNGTAITNEDGGPLRIVVGSAEPGVVTEGSTWVKWVDRIEVKTP